MKGLLKVLGGCILAAALPLSAQDYQTAFTAPSYARENSPSSFHGSFEVESSTGALSMKLGTGPGISLRGLSFVPRLDMRFSQQFGRINPAGSSGQLINDPNMGDDYIPTEWIPDKGMDRRVGGSGVSSTSNGTRQVSFTTGFLKVPMGATAGRRLTYQLPDGSGGFQHGVVPSGMTATVANDLIHNAFGYPANVQVGSLARATTDTPVSFVQVGSNGELILGLVTNPGAGSDELTASVQENVAYSGGVTWTFPRRVLVVQGATATEFTYVNHVYQAITDSNSPLKYGHYVPSRILNRFGDALTFTYDTDGIGYTASLVPSGQASTVSLRVQNLGNITLPSPVLNLDGYITGTSGATQVRVSYQGVSNVSSYLLTLQASQGGALAPGLGSTGMFPATPRGMDLEWDQARLSVQPISVVEEATSATLAFTYGTIGNNSGNNVTQISQPGRTASFTWGPYFYHPNGGNGAGYDWTKISIQPQDWPHQGMGVTVVTETDANGLVRATRHLRVLPQSNWPTDGAQSWDSVHYWTDSTFFSVVVHPDGSATAMRLASPLSTNTPDGDSGMQNLAYLKHAITETREYAQGVAVNVDADGVKTPWSEAQWRTEMAKSASTSAAYQIAVSDRFDVRRVGAPGGELVLASQPYATRTRTWNKNTGVTSVQETGLWDATNHGWTRTYKTSLLSAAPPSGFEWRSPAYQSQEPAQPTGATVYQVKSHNVDSKVALWLMTRGKDGQVQTLVDQTGYGTTGALPLTTKTFDDQNRLTQVQVGPSALQATTTFSAFEGPNPDKVTVTGTFVAPASAGASYTYDAFGHMASIQLDGVTWSSQQASDPLGRPLTQTDPNGVVAHVAYDANGRFAQTWADGEAATIYAYDADQRGVTITRGAQVSWLRYDGFGRLAVEARKGEDGSWSHRVHGHDAVGRDMGVTAWLAGQGVGEEANSGQPNFNATTYTQQPGYTRCVQWGTDTDGNMVCLQEQQVPTQTITHPIIYAQSSRIVYDTFGRVTQAISLNGEVVDHAYGNGDLTETVTTHPTPTTNLVTVLEKDAAGRLVKITDAKNQVTQYFYDAAGRPVKVLQWPGAVGSGTAQERDWTYDSLGRLVALDQPESGVTYFARFTATGKPTKAVYGLPRGWRPANADAEDTTAYTQANVKTVTTAYDATGRITSVTSSDGSVKQTFSYDEAGKGLSKGKLTTAVDGVVTRLMAYNGLNGRLDSLVTRIPSTQDLSQTFSYDTLGNRIGGNTGHGAWTQSYLPVTGLPDQLNYGGQSVTSTPWNAYDAKSWGLLAITYGNTAGSFFEYDGDQVRLRSMAHAFVEGSTAKSYGWRYEYDGAGRLLTDGEDVYTYDELNRLASADVLNPAGQHILQTFTYDAFGNMASRSASGSTPAQGMPKANFNSFAFNSSEKATMAGTNRLPATASGIPTGAVYDAQGNLTDVYKQATSVGAQNLHLAYDALGRVVRSSDDAAGTWETYGYTNEGLRTIIDQYQGNTWLRRRINVYDDARRLVGQYVQGTLDASEVNLVQAVPTAGTTASTHGGNQSIRVWHKQGSNSSVAKSVGTFSVGETVTASVWFKAPVGTKGQIYLGNSASADHLYAYADGNGAWQQLSVTVPVTVAEGLIFDVYGNRDNTTDNSQSITYDDVTVVSSTRGTVFTEGFESGLGTWTTNGLSEVLTASTDTTFSGSKAVQIWHKDSTNSALTKTLGSFSAGDTVTASVWFKARPGISALLYLGVPPESNSLQLAGNGDWQRITISKTMTVAGTLKAILYADKYTSTTANATDYDYIIFDDAQFVGTQAGVEYRSSDGFENGYTGWATSGEPVQNVASAPLKWRRDVVYLGSKQAAEIDVAGLHITQVDHLGSPRYVTTGAGVLESVQKFMPFGETLTGGMIGKGYTNHEQTEDSGLIYMQARFYLPMYGRFASPDPARDQHFDQTQSWNIYSYVQNNPVLYLDPTGAFKEEELAPCPAMAPHTHPLIPDTHPVRAEGEPAPDPLVEAAEIQYQRCLMDGCPDPVLPSQFITQNGPFGAFGAYTTAELGVLVASVAAYEQQPGATVAVTDATEAPDFRSDLEPSAEPMRFMGPWTLNDLDRAGNGLGPLEFAPTFDRAGRLRPLEIHHGGQMPGSGVHEVTPGHGRINGAHNNRMNQGVTDEMRTEDRQLHWYMRSQEMRPQEPIEMEIVD